MKTATTELRDLIESGEFVQVDLYTITLASGEVLRTTSADVLIYWDGEDYPSDRPAIVRDKLSVSLGFEVDSLSLSMYPKNSTPDSEDAADTVSGLPFGQALRAGVFDGATLLLEKAYAPIPEADGELEITGVLHGFEGSMSDIDGGRGEFSVDVKSALELLNTDLPRNLFQSTCLHTLYNSGCTLDRDDFIVSGEVTGSATDTGFDSDLSEAAGYFEQGVLVFTSGVHNGFRRTVKTHATGGVLGFALPLPEPPDVGDTFTIYPGCNRTMATCGAKFNNLSHFKGYPFVPVPETVY